MLSTGLRQAKPRASVHQLSLTGQTSGVRWAGDELGNVQVPYRGRLFDLLVLGGSRDVAAVRNIHMDPDTRALSVQLYMNGGWWVSELLAAGCQ